MNLGAIVVLGAGAFAVGASDAVAQAPVTLSLRPYAAVANLPIQRQQVPFESGEFSTAGFSGTRMLGLEALVSWRQLPFELRVGWSQTVGADIEIQDGFVTESCGPACTLSTAVYSPIGGAAIANGAMDVVFSPFSSRVSPHAFVGVAYRRVRYSPTLAEARSIFGSESEVVRRLGVGVDVRVTRGSAVRIDASEQGGAMWLGRTPDASVWGRVAMLSVGVQIEVLGVQRR